MTTKKEQRKFINDMLSGKHAREHAVYSKDFLINNAKGASLTEIGVVSPGEDDYWKNFYVTSVIQENCREIPDFSPDTDYFGMLELLPDKPAPENFDEKYKHLMLVKMESKGRVEPIVRIAERLKAIMEDELTSHRQVTRYLFCVIYTGDVSPGPEEKILKGLSNEAVDIRLFYISQTNILEMFKLFEEKNRKGEVPSHLEYLRLAFIPMLNEKFRRS